jgi:alkyl hydroperoxide reductase subunit AhpF
MPLLKIYQGRRLKQALAEIVTPVQVTYTALDQPEPDTLTALAELQALTPHLSVSIIHQPAGPVDRVNVRGDHGGELVFLGPPLGAELAALVSAIIIAGRGTTGLANSTRQALNQIQSPVNLEIFTTPT